MAAPNILSISNIAAKTAYLTPANTTENVIITNPASSGKVFKINSIVATNIDESLSIAATVGINSNAAGSGTTYKLAAGISVPVGASVIVTDKSTGIYLEENKSIVVKSGAESKVTYIISYEEIS